MTSFLSAITQRKKTPEQLVVSAKLSVNAYLDGDNTAEENLGKRLAQIKLILYGDGDHPEVDEEKALEVGKSVQSVRIGAYMHENSKWDVCSMFNIYLPPICQRTGTTNNSHS
jgi:hypothetical protein